MPLGRRSAAKKPNQDAVVDHEKKNQEKREEHAYHSEILHLADAVDKENTPRRSGKDNRSGALRRKRKREWVPPVAEESSSESQW